MNFPAEIEKRIKKSSSDSSFVDIVYILMRDLNQPYSEIMKMPIPMALKLVRLWEKQKKAEEKAAKKGAKKR